MTTRLYLNSFEEPVIEILKEHGYRINHDPQDDSYEIMGHESQDGGKPE